MLSDGNQHPRPMPEKAFISPKAFISYSWSSTAHQDWVLTLATRLREDGVDVSLDKWDLKEGHDALAFMERMVSDPAVTKVIMVRTAPTPKKLMVEKEVSARKPRSFRPRFIGNRTKTNFAQ